MLVGSKMGLPCLAAAERVQRCVEHYQARISCEGTRVEVEWISVLRDTLTPC
jgi:hypothetical protein